ncbi:hypothetical protein J4438_01835 [Candidatus Woesearchaeota archaeon]|nr:hypothetical protein [Candidatus Woesearchaeota archaeon]
MGSYKSKPRGGFGSRNGGNRFGGRSEGGSSRFSGRATRRAGKKSFEMHDVICDKCGKECQVPFKPTNDKPVYCSECFGKKEESSGEYGSRKNDNSRSRDRPARSEGMTREQFNNINAKLDKIIQILDNG